MLAARVLAAMLLSAPVQWQTISSISAFCLSPSLTFRPLSLQNSPQRCGPHLRRLHSFQHARMRGGTAAAVQNVEGTNIQLKNCDRAEEARQLELEMGVQFHNTSLLLQALTHASAVLDNLESNQRLEYLGDAVLEMIISSYLYDQHPTFNEGELTSLRKEVVNTRALAKVAKEHKLGKWIHMSKAEESTGGRNKENILADVVEALIAAVYLDQGHPAAREFTLRWFQRVLESAAVRPSGTDHKTRLQELTRRLGIAPPQYFVTEKAERTGPKHNQRFTAHVLCNNNRLGWGVGRNKKAAEQAAAEYSIVVLEEKSEVELLVYAAAP